MEREGIGSNAREEESPARIIEEIGLTRTGFPGSRPPEPSVAAWVFGRCVYSVISDACKYPPGQALAGGCN